MMEQLKNFIRHGKHARSTAQNLPLAKEAANNAPISSLSPQTAASSPAMQSDSKMTPEKVSKRDVELIVAQESAEKSKLPKYPGLEKYLLVQKMGE